MTTDATNQHIQALETRLLHPDVRADPAQLAGLLADNFVEFGSSGRVWTKDDVLRELPDQKSLQRATIANFEVSRLGHDLLQARYLLLIHNERGEQRSLRSSIWERTDGAWRMRFHQGTPVQAG